MSERDWVETIKPDLQRRMSTACAHPDLIRVNSQHRLSYNHSIDAYKGEDAVVTHQDRYATDLLLRDEQQDGSWTPRVVIEVKIGSVTTHDALTYSSKAETHKTVHPYLRYGILIAGYEGRSLPARLYRHGAHFDFMMTWDTLKPAGSDWSALVGILAKEVEASRLIQEFLRTNRLQQKKRYIAMHRPVVFT